MAVPLSRRRAARPAPSPVPLLPGRWLAAVATASVAADAALLRLAGLHVGPGHTLVAILAVAAAAAAACHRLRAAATPRQRFARDAIEGVALFALVSLLGVVASYPLAGGGRPLVDAALARADLDLHFRWMAWYGWIAGHPWLRAGERAAYLSIYVTPVLLILAFARAGDRARCRGLVATYWVAIVATLALARLLPALGPLAGWGRGPLPYVPLTSLAEVRTILALRRHTLATIDLDGLCGLVCTPSFHAASAVIFAAAAWRVPSLRWPVAAVEAAMLLATPIEGTHYLSDLIGGAVVACVALRLTPLLIGWAADGGDPHPARESLALVAAE